MPKYDFQEHQKNEKHRFALVQLVSGFTEKEWESIDPAQLDVELRLEGIEVDFLRFTDAFFRQIDHLVKQKAEDIVGRKVGDLRMLLDDLEELLQDKLDALEVASE
jgi:hypothetical protein